MDEFKPQPLKVLKIDLLKNTWFNQNNSKNERAV